MGVWDFLTSGPLSQHASPTSGGSTSRFQDFANNHRWAMRGAGLGVPGIAAGIAADSLIGWFGNREVNGPIDAQAPMNQRVADQTQNTQDAIWGGLEANPNLRSDWNQGPPDAGYGPDYNMGPPAQGDPSQGAAQPWFNDTTMSADDPLGLVPDYGQDGPPDGRGSSPSARRDGTGWGANSGISNMTVGGQNVIIGQDPNQMAVRRMVDFGG